MHSAKRFFSQQLMKARKAMSIREFHSTGGPLVPLWKVIVPGGQHGVAEHRRAEGLPALLFFLHRRHPPANVVHMLGVGAAALDILQQKPHVLRVLLQLRLQELLVPAALGLARLIVQANVAVVVEDGVGQRLVDKPVLRPPP